MFRPLQSVSVGVILCALGGASAMAGIVSVGGNVQLVGAPVDARPNAFTDDEYIRAWNERQNVSLSSGVLVNAVLPGVYDDGSDLVLDTITSGTFVSSHYLHFDAELETERRSNGDVVFDNDILGVIVLGDADTFGRNLLDASDFLGLPITTYTDGQFNRGLEMGAPLDRFAIMSDQRTLNIINLFISFPGDGVRVITRGEVPAPTGAMALSVAGVLLASRRRR